MFIEILLIWLAFGLVYFQEHFRNILQTLQPNPFSWRRWEAVMKGTFTKKTVFPLIVLVLLTTAIIYFDFSRQENIDILIERIDKLIDLMEAQNATYK